MLYRINDRPVDPLTRIADARVSLETHREVLGAERHQFRSRGGDATTGTLSGQTVGQVDAASLSHHRHTSNDAQVPFRTRGVIAALLGARRGVSIRGSSRRRELIL
jgi:hypothetical protein